MNVDVLLSKAGFPQEASLIKILMTNCDRVRFFCQDNIYSTLAGDLNLRTHERGESTLDCLGSAGLCVRFFRVNIIICFKLKPILERHTSRME